MEVVGEEQKEIGPHNAVPALSGLGEHVIDQVLV